ncbi:MAG: extracellular solute-binding protein [Chloroflexota bacterium]
MKATQSRLANNRQGGATRLCIAPAALRLVLAALALSLLAGCTQWLQPLLPDLISSPPTATLPPTRTPEAPFDLTATPEPLPPVGGNITLTVWLPPQFDPQAGTPAGDLMKARLEAFMEDNPGVLIYARIKAASGPGGLLESLTATTAAAPRALPSVVALNRSDLEAAALKGLIHPVEGISTALENPDWYPYARQLASVQGIPFGLPFAGDALMLFYRPAATGGTSPQTWEEILSFGSPMIFAADDPQAMLTLTLYRSLGGLVQDLQNRPALQAESLEQVLNLFQDGMRRGTFPATTTQFQSAGQVWQAFLEGQSDWAVTWSSFYLSSLPPDIAPQVLPSLGTDEFTQAAGWVWAIAEPDAQRREVSVALAEYLSDVSFLAQWAPAAGYLPVHPTSLNNWQPATLQVILSQVVLSAQVRPTNEVMVSIGPVLREASLAVLRNQSSASQAAQSAAEKLGAP